MIEKEPLAENWTQIRSKGKWHFILFHPQGTIFGVAMAIVLPLINHWGDNLWSHLLRALVMLPILFSLGSWWIWCRYEKNYRISSASDSPNKPA